MDVQIVFCCRFVRTTRQFGNRDKLRAPVSGLTPTTITSIFRHNEAAN